MYATLDDARRELGTTTTNTTADAQLFSHLTTVSRRVHDLTGLDFEPVRATEYLPIRADLIRSDLRLYYLPRPALALNAVTIYNTSLTVGTHVRGWPTNKTPFRAIQLVATDGDWAATYYDSNYDPLITVDATWGYHPTYPTAWHTADAVLNVGGITSGGTSITVTDADGTDWQGMTPRFSPGHLLRIESEYLRVTAVNTVTNALTVVRAINGTTAAAHALSAAIETWTPEPAIRQAVARQAALLYKRQGALTAPTQMGMGGSYPPDLLSDLYAVLQGYANGN
jgi:hypothetical protein